MIGLNAKLWFFIGFLGMTAATIYPAYKYYQTREKLNFYLSQIAITGIAMVAYLFMYLNIGIININGTEVALTRYMDWLLTTPFMVATLAALSKPGNETVVKLIVLDLLVMSVGILGPFVDFPMYWVLFGFGCICFAAMAYLIMGPISSGPGLENEAINMLFVKLRNLTLVLWALYPLVVVLAPQALGLLNVEGQALVVSYLDIISKGVFVVIATKGAEKIDEISFSFTQK